MKHCDRVRSVLILKMIERLTDELTSIEIHAGNPDGSPDHAITVRQVNTDPEIATDVTCETFYADSIFECLLKAMAARGITDATC